MRTPKLHLTPGGGCKGCERAPSTRPCCLLQSVQESKATDTPAPDSPRYSKWSPSEKAAARKAFELALDRECQAAIRETKERAARISEDADLWTLERWLGERRREIDRTFDYRYSVLLEVFADLLRSGRLADHELPDLAPAKMEVIRRLAGHPCPGAG